MTRLQCEMAIIAKMTEIRKIYEEFLPIEEPVPHLSISISKATPEEEAEDEWHGWRGSVTAFTIDDDDNPDYLLNAFVCDGELWRGDDRTLIKGVEI